MKYLKIFELFNNVKELAVETIESIVSEFKDDDISFTVNKVSGNYENRSPGDIRVCVFIHKKPSKLIITNLLHHVNKKIKNSGYNSKIETISDPSNKLVGYINIKNS